LVSKPVPRPRPLPWPSGFDRGFLTPEMFWALILLAGPKRWRRRGYLSEFAVYKRHPRR